MNPGRLNLILLAAAWAAYLGIHSLLASLKFKRWMAERYPGAMPAYRLGYNALATLLLLPVAWLYWQARAEPLWRWEGAAAWLANGLALAAVTGFFWSLRYYDGAEFLGLRQWRERRRRVEEQEHLHISPLHRFVRHPWYSLGLVILWTRDMDPALLVTAVVATVYLALGSRLEERKLVAYYGDTYRQYRARVPGLVPLPWRWLDRPTAARLEQQARSPASDRATGN